MGIEGITTTPTSTCEKEWVIPKEVKTGFAAGYVAYVAITLVAVAYQKNYFDGSPLVLIAVMASWACAQVYENLSGKMCLSDPILFSKDDSNKLKMLKVLYVTGVALTFIFGGRDSVRFMKNKQYSEVLCMSSLALGSILMPFDFLLAFFAKSLYQMTRKDPKIVEQKV
jgi:hypothetical protein